MRHVYVVVFVLFASPFGPNILTLKGRWSYSGLKLTCGRTKEQNPKNIWISYILLYLSQEIFYYQTVAMWLKMRHTYISTKKWQKVSGVFSRLVVCSISCWNNRTIPRILHCHILFGYKMKIWLSLGIFRTNYRGYIILLIWLLTLTKSNGWMKSVLLCRNSSQFFVTSLSTSVVFDLAYIV